MAKALKPIDISSIPKLLTIAEEVRRTNEPRMLRRDSEDVAILMPIKSIRKRRITTKSKEDYEAFRSAAGSWADVNTDRLIKDIYESRRRSSRPPVNL